MMKLSSILSYAWRISSCVRLRILTDAAVGVARIGCGLLFIWLSKQLIDIAVGDAAGDMLLYSLLLIGTVALETACAVLQGNLETATEAGLKNSLRHTLFVRVMNSTWNGREQFHTADVVNRLEEDARITAETLCRMVPATLVSLCQAAGAFVFLCALSPVLGWIIAGILPLFLLTAKLYTRRMRSLTTDIRATDSRVQTLIQEHLQHRILLLGMMRVVPVFSRLGTLQSELYGKVMRRNRFTQFTRTMMLLGFGAGYLTAFLWGVAQLQQGALTFGVLTAFLQLVGQVQRPTADLSRQLPGLVHALTSLSRLAELDTLTPEAKVLAPHAEALDGVRFDRVTFAYPDGRRKILDGFTHDFHSGTSTAIMGETGAGKSTLMRLMLGLLRPQEGAITLYNKEKGLTAEASAATRSAFVLVPQGNSLLSGTIRANLLLGNPAATAEQLQEALHTAAADFVHTLPQGLDTPCGEGGAGLSEGQAQRIAIARGLLCAGRILLLDEFSSALDADTEHLLMERLTAHAAGKTLIFITHRPEIARRCNEIIRLNK